MSETGKQITSIIMAIDRAKKYKKEDPQLAAYALRDLDIVKDNDLSDLAWAMTQDGSVTENDVDFLIEQIEKHL